MSAFEDNPFAEDDDEMTPHLEVTSRKRGREEDVMEGLTSAWSTQPEVVPAPLAAATTSTATLFSESFAVQSSGDTSGFDVSLTGSLLAEYDAGQEEDEFNALVVKAASLESELKQLEKAYNDELNNMSKDNGSLKESVDLLRVKLMRSREEIEALQRGPISVNTESNKSLDFVELMEVVSRKVAVFEREATELERRLARRDSEGIIDAALTEHVRSCINGKLDELPDLVGLDSQAERCRLEVCEAAITKLRSERVMHVALPLVETMMTKLRELVTRYDAMYKDTNILHDRVAHKTCSLRELTQDSLEWYICSARRAFLGGDRHRELLPSAFTETQEGILCNQQLEATLHHMESVVHQLLLIPNIVAASHQNAPFVAAASAFALCQELGSHTEILGREVLRLRKLLATDTATLQRLGGLRAAEEAMLKQEGTCVTADRAEWLLTLTKTLTERLISSDALLHSLKTFSENRSASAMGLQLAFYKRYVEMQETLLCVLSVLNGSLQNRAHVVAVMRQVALHDGDDGAVSMLAERVLQDSQNDISGLPEELERMCAEAVRQFTDEASFLFCEEEVSVKQNTSRLRDVRNFFVDTVQTLDQLVYGNTPRIGVILELLKETPLTVPAEAPENFFQVIFSPSDDASHVLVQMASSDHDQELREEVSAIQRRNAELMKCMKWLSMQRFHSVVPQLRCILKKIDVLRQELAVLTEREARWTALKDELSSVQGEIAAVQDATAAIKIKLNDLHERTRVASKLVSESSGS